MAMGSFEMQIKAFSDKSEKNVKLACQKIAMEAFSRIIYRTPVDTGRLRANWGCQVDSPSSGTTESTDKEGAATVSKATKVTTSWDATGSIYLTNNLQYAIPIEYCGSPVKSPQGMVRVTVAEMSGVAESIARKI
ncbi:MAG: HK97 gp10 family phage protein [Spirochaetales bacterium]|jgi:hypothetical protein|nr:HK97 gp10 family phage protein [Spirochaetales bacterium]